jgi:hypothetical protein
MKKSDLELNFDEDVGQVTEEDEVDDGDDEKEDSGAHTSSFKKKQ